MRLSPVVRSKRARAAQFGWRRAGSPPCRGTMTTCSTWSSVTVRGAPGRGSSSNPSARSRAKRTRFLPTGRRRQPQAAGPPSGCYDRRRRQRTTRARRFELAGTCEEPSEPATPDASPVRRPSERWQPLGVPCARVTSSRRKTTGVTHAILPYLRGQDTSLLSQWFVHRCC